MNTRTEQLISRKVYAPEVASRIDAMGVTAVSIANRWLLGWPDRVAKLLKTKNYLDSLESQVEQERAVILSEANLRHLARREILALYEIKESPPCPA